MEPMLKNWYLEEHKFKAGKRIVRGNVIKSAMSENNHSIATIEIQDIATNDPEECLEILAENTVYYCYWRDCNFEACHKVSEYIPNFEIYRKKYIEDALLPLEKNSIVLLYRNSPHYFPHVFIRLQDEVERMDFHAGTTSLILPLDTKDGKYPEAEIQYDFFGGCQVQFYYMDVHENMSVFVENHGEETLHINCGTGVIDIAPRERKDVLTDYQPDYMKFAQHSTSLPKNIAPFAEETIILELEHRGVANPDKHYMMIRKWCVNNETEVKDERFRVIASHGIGVSLIKNAFQLTQKLVASGVPFELDDAIKIQMYNISGEHMVSAEIALMEWIANNWEIPDDVFTFLWTKAKERCTLPLQHPLEIKLNHGHQKASVLVNQILKLNKIWEEAAKELLMAQVVHFLNTELPPTDGAWRVLLAEFPDMREKLIRKIIAHFMSRHLYEIEKDIMAYWRIYLDYEDAEAAKETIIHILQEYLQKICTSEERLIWFISMLLDREMVFGNMQLGSRDACMRILLSQRLPCTYVWRCLLSTDFIPAIYVDEYIDNVKNTQNKYLIPLLISAKFADKKD